MMKHTFRHVLTLLCLLMLTSTASAENKLFRWFSSDWSYPGGTRQKFKHGKLWPPFARPTGKSEPFMHKYHRAHYWPLPYVCEDRNYVRQVLYQQTENGWTGYTTLYDHHFDVNTQELNQSGRRHLRWIAFHAPQEHRKAYVAEGYSPKDSQIRLANVRASLAALMPPEAGAPPVMLRRAIAVGRPAEEVDEIRRAYLESIPIPRVPTESSEGEPEL